VFERIDFHIGGRITELATPDLNGDGQRDLLVIRGREALIFFQGAEGRWATRPNQRFRFHPRTILFDVGDIDGDGKAEIVLLQSNGIYAYFLAQRGERLLYGLRPRKLVGAESFFSNPIKKEVRRKRFLRDVDSDGDLDLVLPRPNGFDILANSSGSFAPARQLAAPPTAILHLGRPRLSSQIFASYWFPNPNVVQWDAEGGNEIVLAREADVSVYGAPKEGELPLRHLTTFTIPEQRQLSMAVENPLELDFNLPLQLRDLDGDGRVDVSATHVGKGTTRIYRNAKDNPAKAFQSPAQSLRAKGVTFLAYYSDMNGDGLADLVIPRMDPISAWSVIKVLVTRSVPIEMMIFYQRKETFFQDEPDVVRELEIPVSLNTGGDRIKIGTSVVATVDGDYDGDGHRDLLYRTSDDELSFYGGRATFTLDEEPFATATIPSVEDYRFCLPAVVDIDGDGKDDVLLRYLSWDRDEDSLTLLRSRLR
jgi:hypothetical protein